MVGLYHRSTLKFCFQIEEVGKLDFFFLLLSDHNQMDSKVSKALWLIMKERKKKF
jgi:hypothetical protein